MNKLNFFLIISLVIIGGCAQRLTPASVAQANSDSLNMSIKESQERTKKCLDKIAKNPSVQYVYANILYENLTSPNKIELLSSTAKLTDSQKKYLIEYYSLIQQCRPDTAANLIDFPSIISALNRSYGDGDIIIADLLAKKITIGEANKEKIKLQVRVTEEVNNSINSIQNGYIRQYNQDANRQTAEDNNRRAIAAGYLMNMQNQINSNRPINTNCTKFGNQVNCTTQ